MKVIISGLINVETTLKVEGFPIPYFPITYPFHGVQSSVSGVGVNIGKALKTLGDDVVPISLVGEDFQGLWTTSFLEAEGIPSHGILKKLKETPQSVILYEPSGRREIYTDLKDVQEQEYPSEMFIKELEDCDLAVLCNINFSRPFLKKAKELKKLIATDVHVLSDPYDEYNKDFLQNADILFMSHEQMGDSPWDFAWKIAEIYKNKIIVVGLGEHGALMYVKEENNMFHYPSVYTRPVVNTVGAGDSLFSAFLHFYCKGENPHSSLKKAITFASYKIGEKGASCGFLNEKELETFYKG